MKIIQTVYKHDQCIIAMLLEFAISNNNCMMLFTKLYIFINLEILEPVLPKSSSIYKNWFWYLKSFTMINCMHFECGFIIVKLFKFCKLLYLSKKKLKY